MRGLQWFNALSGDAAPVSGLPNSLKVADGVLGDQPVREPGLLQMAFGS